MVKAHRSRRRERVVRLRQEAAVGGNWNRICRIAGGMDYHLHCRRTERQVTSLTLTLSLTSNQPNTNHSEYDLTCTTTTDGVLADLTCDVGLLVKTKLETGDARASAWITLTGCTDSNLEQKIIAEQPPDNFLPATRTVRA